MNITISPSSDKPIYIQIFDQISADIIRGTLKPGEALPPIRTVAKELQISVITIKKAWELLEKEKFINTMVGKGCFVAARTDNAKCINDYALERLKNDLNYCKSIGLSIDEVIELIKENYK